MATKKAGAWIINWKYKHTDRTFNEKIYLRLKYAFGNYSNLTNIITRKKDLNILLLFPTWHLFIYLRA